MGKETGDDCATPVWTYRTLEHPHTLRRGRPQTRATWYQPLEEQAAIDKAIHWVLGRPGVFLNTVGDITLLPRVLDAAARFEQAPTDASDFSRYYGPFIFEAAVAETLGR